ncbi:MAG: KpsF/GutQ family sugar-phosphate isomerase, partial [Flavobacteriaceae bacterium]|nr:KpsF/GutQ family sugar-phosphate isomerase [Flavobacteriaceae bacterium]
MNSKFDIIKAAKNSINNQGQSILKLGDFVNEDFKETVELINRIKGRVIISGIGKSALIGTKIVATLNSTGTPAIFMHASEAVHGDLGIHQKNDPVIFLSNSATTPELLALEPIIRKRKGKIVGIMGNMNGALAKKVDVFLDASVTTEADPLGIVPTSSFMVAAALGDALASGLMQRRNFTETDYAKTHPAGQLGRNLLLTVKDVMHNPSKIAKVSPQTSIRKLVIEMTKFPLGAACVMEENKLIGIITDGDLRRA